MIKALYYPFTTIRSQNLIKTALLLWDSVECIVPRRGWQIEKPFKQKSYNEALDLIVRPYVPKLPERRLAHSDVVEYFKEASSPQFFRTTLRRRYRHNYLIYPEKFLKTTWHELQRHGLARLDAMSSDYVVPPALGLLMMSSLADACAGSQIQKVTDMFHAYSLLAEARAVLLGAPFVEGLDVSQVAPELDRLVTLSLSVLDARKIPVKKLLAFRKREAKGSSADYRKLRLNYLNTLHAYIDRMRNKAKSAKDVKEIERQFRLDMRDDLLSLKHELNLASIETLFSKEMVLSLIAVGGAFLEPISGLTNLAITMQGIGVIPLVKTRIKHKNKRRKALRNHKMSWLYLTQEKGLSLR